MTALVEEREFRLGIELFGSDDDPIVGDDELGDDAKLDDVPLDDDLDLGLLVDDEDAPDLGVLDPFSEEE